MIGFRPLSMTGYIPFHTGSDWLPSTGSDRFREPVPLRSRRRKLTDPSSSTSLFHRIPTVRSRKDSAVGMNRLEMNPTESDYSLLTWECLIFIYSQVESSDHGFRSNPIGNITEFSRKNSNFDAI